MFLPHEIIFQIFKNDFESLYLIDRECTREHFKRKLDSLGSFTNIPIYKNPIFPYYAYITELYVSALNMDELVKWADFPYSLLLNCIKIEIGALDATGISDNDIIFCLVRALNNIRKQMPWLRDLRPEGLKDATCVLEIFKNSYLKRIELGDVCDNFHLLSTMPKLTSLYVTDSRNLPNVKCTLPNITELEIFEYDELTLPESCNILNNMMRVFPNLISFITTPDHQQLINSIPTKIKRVELVCYDIKIELPLRSVYFDTLAISIMDPGTNEPTAPPNLTILDVLMNHSKTWILAIGLPSFLIITNHKHFQDIVKWYPFIFERNTNNLEPFFHFEHREFNNLHFHINGPRTKSNAFDEEGLTSLEYQHFVTCSLNILKRLGNDKIINWIESNF